MPFKKGQSGNPAGNKKEFEAALRVAVNDSVDGKKKLRVIAEKLVECALNGDAWAIQAVADRMDGKPRQEVDNSHTHDASDAFVRALEQMNEGRKGLAVGVDRSGDTGQPEEVRH